MEKIYANSLKLRTFCSWRDAYSVLLRQYPENTSMLWHSGQKAAKCPKAIPDFFTKRDLNSLMESEFYKLRSTDSYL